ncbi:ATPase [Altererythrobacter salegens]|uniref:ATPase n=1 Tax=Croceibacterium salegens TaxID=1737568 RepID=A0A6I4SW44_9SPHN|nr:SRPBCC family protein [Croceibacterium salegens]MXO59270.1 ATPase [Croceibacterium salegens]
MIRIASFALGGVLALTCQPAAAEVLRTSPDGFAVTRTETLGVPPAEAWRKLIHIADWWSAEHSWSGDAANFSLDPRAGGCFCEALPDGGSVEHMRIIYAAPGQRLRMTGTLGPLQSESLLGVLTVTLEAAGEGTKLVWTYKVSGVSDIPLEGLAPVVEGVIGEQFDRLATGKP